MQLFADVKEMNLQKTT